MWMIQWVFSLVKLHETCALNKLCIYISISKIPIEFQTIEDVCKLCLVWFVYADQNHDVNDQNINIAAKMAYDIVKCDAPLLLYVGCDFKFSTRPLNKITLLVESRMQQMNGRFAMNVSDRENPDRFSMASPV